MARVAAPDRAASLLCGHAAGRRPTRPLPCGKLFKFRGSFFIVRRTSYDVTVASYQANASFLPQ
jgi:hypothetical protein